MTSVDTITNGPTSGDASSVRLKEGFIKLSGDGVFYTLQGEGRSIGKPAVFIRLHLCNLTCVWCDSAYTWNRKLPEYWTESRDISIAALTSEVKQYPAKTVVITGGEPLLQQKLLVSFIENLEGLQIEFETNGTIIPEPYLAERCLFNVSPKLGNSEIPLTRRIKPEAIKIFNKLPGTNFKFVLNGPEDLVEIKNLISTHGIDSDKIILMPQGTDDKILRDKLAGLAEHAKEFGWRLLPRLHVQIWGNRRAV